MSDTLLTKKEAAVRLGVSVKTIERRIKKGDLARVLVHGEHGPEVRVVLPATPDVTDATFTVADATPDEGATPDRAVVVYHVAGETPPSTPEGAELAVLALRALDDMRAERDELRAVVESLRRPWWRKIGDRLRRAR